MVTDASLPEKYQRAFKYLIPVTHSQVVYTPEVVTGVDSTEAP